MNTIQYSPKAVRYMQQVFPWARQNRRRKPHLDRYICFCMAHYGDRPTDRPTAIYARDRKVSDSKGTVSVTKSHRY